RLQPQRPARHPQPPRQGGQVKDQRGVREGELGEVDHDVPRAREGARERGTTKTLRRAILVATTPQNRGLRLEVDDERDGTATNGPKDGPSYHVRHAHGRRR